MLLLPMAPQRFTILFLKKTTFPGVEKSSNKREEEIENVKVYSKSGKQVKTFPSNLPGGNRSQGGRFSDYEKVKCGFFEKLHTSAIS